MIDPGEERDAYRSQGRKWKDLYYAQKEATRQVRVRFCPAGAMTEDEDRSFSEMPHRGETILREEDERRYVVVEIDWQPDGSPFLIAHEWGRPRAQAVLYGKAD